MSHLEIRASLMLASVFALRMLGLFLILPVFTIYAQHLPGGEHPVMLGLALGIYGLIQAFLHIPLGMLSDRIGRKPVIMAGLLLFVLGGSVAAMADSLAGIAWGRAIQGAGAISAAITALIADLTRVEHRSKAMAMVGGSIGLSFAISLVIAAPLYQHIGMNGLFWLMSALGCGALLLVAWGVPTPIKTVISPSATRLSGLRDALCRVDLLRLNIGVLILHATQIAMFIVVPRLLTAAGLPLSAHWQIYLPVVLCSFVLMLAPMLAAERAGKTRLVLLSAVALLFFVQIGFAMQSEISIAAIAVLLLLFFTGFNLLEAMQPALVSRLADEAKGTALGVYNTSQALGLFLGGALGGGLLKFSQGRMVFIACAILLFVWLIIARNMQEITRCSSART
ncbi:MAG: MFS transporter [Ottowia sp.]|nr:MFS transporter [Ottowia sp.]